jgi:hypothetical protein
MTTLNHALWGATIGRMVGMPVEGAIAGSMPDILSLPFQALFRLQGKHKPEVMPRWVFWWYSLLHNWFFGALISLTVVLVSSKYWFLGAAYLLHVFEDAFVHTDFATSFLLPLWKGKIKSFSAHQNMWVQVVDIILILGVNIFLSVLNIH